MRLKLILCFLGYLFLFGIVNSQSVNAQSNSLPGQFIALTGNEIPWDIPVNNGHRSITPPIPIMATLSYDSFVDISFLESVGNVEIIISQNGTPIYSSSENILTVDSKRIELAPELSGTFLLEIKGANGAYAYGSFDK